MGVLFHSWISLEVHLFWIYFLHQNVWFPGKMNFLLGSEKKISSENVVQNRFFHNMDTRQYLPVAAPVICKTMVKLSR